MQRKFSVERPAKLQSCLALLLVLSCGSLRAEGIGPIVNAARETKPIADLRLRSETVEQAGIAEDAEAATLRARLGFETGKAWNTALLVDADLLWPLQDDYNSTINGKTGFPVVADPETYEINRLQLANTSIPGTTVTLGRQRIVLDEQRFVGNVGWRQNEQTFDAVRITNKSIANLTVDLTYLDQVNRVFSKDSPVGRYHGDNYLANVGYQTPFGKLTGFAYLLEFEEARSDSSRTVGLRFAGNRPVGRIKLAYSASFATQQDRAGNPLNYDNDFRALELSGAFRQYTLGAGIEVLDGNGVKGFATPLATLHKFQGWADKYLTTPVNGIEDRYASFGYLRKGIGVLDTFAANVSYHTYDAQRLALDYGSEINVELQAKWRRITGALKYADYEADRFATDTRKWWLQAEFVW